MINNAREVFIRVMKRIDWSYSSAGNVNAKIGRRRESEAIVLLRLEDDYVELGTDEDGFNFFLKDDDGTIEVRLGMVAVELGIFHSPLNQVTRFERYRKDNNPAFT